MASNPFHNEALLSCNPHQGHKTLNPPTPLRDQSVPGSVQVNSQRNDFFSPKFSHLSCSKSKSKVSMGPSQDHDHRDNKAPQTGLQLIKSHLIGTP